MSVFASAAASALNRLLARETWARDKLAPFGGEIVELRFAPLRPLRMAIADGGRAAPANDSDRATLVITARRGILAALAQGEEELMGAVEISGNARLATEILALMHYLRWDIEEDLSRVVGDALAHRMAGVARDLAAWHVQAGKRLAEIVVEYAVEERRGVLARREFDAFATGVAKLRDDLDRLEWRVERLGR